MLTKTLKLGAPRVTTEAGGSRIDADICGEHLYVKANAPLAASSEALVAAFYLIAMHQGATLRCDGPLDPQFARNLPAVADFAGRHLDLSHRDVEADIRRGPPKAGASASFFTGGIDSFYSLSRHTADLDALIYIVGFDIPCGDQASIQNTLPQLRRVAEASGQFLIEMETNLRELRLFRSLNWELTHGAALAAMALFLTGQVGRVFVPSSDASPRGRETAWGSDPVLVESWSSDSLEIVYDDSGARRIDKVTALAGFPLALDHLRVCWLNDVPGGNCGVCEKCVRTMAMLEVCGALQEVKTLPHDGLSERIRALPPFTWNQRRMWQTVLDHPNCGPLTAAIEEKLGAPMQQSFGTTPPIGLSRLKWQIKNFRLVGQMLR